MFRSQCPSAKISDNKVVLSLPDAMTPVVWVMDVADSGTFVMKVDKNENGQYILQKISDEGKKIEDVAYYASRKNAVNAMTTLTKTIDSGKSNHHSTLWCLLSFIRSSVVFVASLGILVILVDLFFDDVFSTLFNHNSIETSQQQSIPHQPPSVATDPNAVGVPMSADDFLNQKGSSGLPF